MSEEDIRATRLEKVEQLRQLGMNPYAYHGELTHHAAELQEKFADLPSGEEVDVEVAVAGRIMARRVFGKLAFFTLQDETGTIQLYLEKKRIEEGMADFAAAFDNLKQLTDVGDILGAKGTIKRTEKGELSVYVKKYTILTKSLLPLPDKWHGLTDVAKRYRQRYMLTLKFGKHSAVALSLLRVFVATWNSVILLKLKLRFCNQKQGVQMRVRSLLTTTL
jgi:lysyl-tRNA synthetase, class II